MIDLISNLAFMFSHTRHTLQLHKSEIPFSVVWKPQAPSSKIHFAAVLTTTSLRLVSSDQKGNLQEIYRHDAPHGLVIQEHHSALITKESVLTIMTGGAIQECTNLFPELLLVGFFASFLYSLLS